MTSKKEGWDYGHKANVSDNREEDVIQHRIEMERKCLKSLRDDLEPLLEGYNVEFITWKEYARIEVTKKGDPLKRSHSVVVSFKYDSGWMQVRGKALGLSVRGDGVYSSGYTKEVKTLNRTYGYDFENLKPKSLKKIAETIGNHLRDCRAVRDEKENRISKALEVAKEAVQLLTMAGFEANYHGTDEDVEIHIKDVVRLRVRSSGIIWSTGRFESVPIKATTKNIVPVVRAIKNLNEFIAKGEASE